PYVSINACAGVSFGLPDSENGTGRILDYCHAAIGSDVKRLFHRGAARGYRLRGCVIRILNGNIAEPVRWDSLLQHVTRQLVKTANVFPVELDDRVNPGGTHRLVVVIPTKKFLVKFLGGVSIGSAELYPAKIAWFVFGEFLHSCFGH